MTHFVNQVPRSENFTRDFLTFLKKLREGRIKDIRALRIGGYALSEDPPDPEANSYNMWQSDGTKHQDGQLYVKITDSGGNTLLLPLTDADNYQISWDPLIYTPDDTISEADSQDSLAAHLKGIDTKVGAHSVRHIRGGADELDGDKLDIDWNPSNYSPSTSPSQVSSVDHLTAHLKGVDLKLADVAYKNQSQTISGTWTFTKGVYRQALSSDPADPPANQHVVWQSDGTGSGADGDIMMKITDSGGTTKTTTLKDFSTL